MEETILLWQEEAPFTRECPGQAQPSLAPFPVRGSRGAVVICPGGGYHFKAPYEGAPVARLLNAHGISAYVLDYRVAPCPYEAPLEDARRAIQTLRARGYEKVAIMGFSAGGHLCCAAAVHDVPGDPAAQDPVARHSSRPDAFIPCYAVVSMGDYTNQKTRKMLLADRSGEADLLRFLSAEENVTDHTPPAFIWHTAEDETVPVQNSLMLAGQLAAHRIPFEMHIYPKGPHGLGLAPEYGCGAWGRDVCRWLLEMGYGV